MNELKYCSFTKKLLKLKIADQYFRTESNRNILVIL